MATALTTTAQKPTGIATYLSREDVSKNISSVIGKENTTRFISSVVSAVQANPSLAKCTNSSILSAALQGEALQLPPSPQLGMFYMTPYKNKKKVNGQWVDVEEVQFSIGWRGMVQLAIRSGQYKSIVVSDVRAGEADFDPITETIDLHPIKDPALREKTEIVGYYAMFELLNGFKKQLFSSVETLKAHAKRYSRGYRYDIENGKKSSPWSTNFDSMCRKTMIRQLIGKWGIMSVEMQQAYVADQAVIESDGSVRYVDNPNAVPVEVQVQEDIETNANTEEFVEAEVEPVKEEAPASKPKGRPKKQEEPAPEPPVMAYEDYPDEPDFNS